MIKKFFGVSMIIAFLLGSCSSPADASLPKEIMLYGWVEYMPQSVMDAFTQETGITVKYVSYESQEDAAQSMRDGNVYDLVILGPEFIPTLLQENLLQPIDYSLIPNFKYISPNFRELAFDPGNKFSVPFHWGTTGILVRTDLVNRPITSWNDLWDDEFSGKVGIWPIPRAIIPIALKALGYSANSENPDELAKAEDYLLKLKPNAVIVSNLESSVVPMMERGEVVIAYGWAYDAILAADQNLPIEYILPDEGSVLWTDHFVIPSNANNPQGAEMFLDFILRPEIAGQIINESFYPMPHDTASAYVLPQLLNNPVIYPDAEHIKNAEITLPLDAERQVLYDQIWAGFLAGK